MNRLLLLSAIVLIWPCIDLGPEKDKSRCVELQTRFRSPFGPLDEGCAIVGLDILPRVKLRFLELHSLPIPNLRSLFSAV